MCVKIRRYRRIRFGAELVRHYYNIIILVVGCPVHGTSYVFITTYESVASRRRRRRSDRHGRRRCQLISSVAREEFDAPDDFLYRRRRRRRAREQFVRRRSYTPYYYYYYHYTSLGQQPVYASGATRPAPTCNFFCRPKRRAYRITVRVDGGRTSA